MSLDRKLAKARRLGIPEILIAAAVLDGVLDALIDDTRQVEGDSDIAAKTLAARRAEKKFGPTRWSEMTAEERSAEADKIEYR